MSATNRGSVVLEHEFYPTPPWTVGALLRKWQPPTTGEWLEPCAGDGAIINAVANHYSNTPMNPRWTAVEIRPEESRQMLLMNDPIVDWHTADFLKWKPKKGQRFSVCLTNPPFSLAIPIIEHALTFSDRVAMLLRLDFLGTRERGPFHEKNISDLYKLRKRPSFTGGGTDSCEYCWFVWGEGGGRWNLLDT